MKKLLVGLALGLIVGLSAGYAISTQSQSKKPQNGPTIAQLLTLVNAERAKNGVAPLKEDPRLDASAQMKANDEVAYNYFGHERNGVFVGQQFINGTGISCTLDDENLTENINQNTAQSAVTAWINSAPHHKAMIDPAYTLTGFGIDGDELVEHFCQTS